MRELPEPCATAVTRRDEYDDASDEEPPGAAVQMHFRERHQVRQAQVPRVDRA